VLIVDDFPDALALYGAILAEDGHRVRTANGGVDALRKVEEQEPELVLLDVSMPGLDGVEVLRRLRARRGGGPAVVMLTAARSEPYAIEAGLKEGADAYLTKPIDSRELLARVRAALETFRLKRMLEAQRRDHIAMLVHDLRHPLSSLALIAEVLEAEETTPEDRRVVVGQMRAMCTEMTRLVEGVLDGGWRWSSRARSIFASGRTRRSSARRSTTSWPTLSSSRRAAAGSVRGSGARASAAANGSSSR